MIMLSASASCTAVNYRSPTARPVRPAQGGMSLIELSLSLVRVPALNLHPGLTSALAAVAIRSISS